MATLFTLHREIDQHEVSQKIEMPDGSVVTETVKFAIQAPSHGASEYLRNFLTKARAEEATHVDQDQAREEVLLRAQALPTEGLIRLLLILETPLALDNADLIPRDEKLSPEEQDKRAMEAYGEKRRPELEATSREDLVTLYVNTQTRVAIGAKAMQKYLDEQLCVIIVDPETRKPLLSNNPQAENWIGNLAEEVIAVIRQKREEFFTKLTDRDIRREAEDPDFLSSGRSRRRRRASRGRMAATSTSSPPPSSDSSAVASGMTESVRL